MKIDTVTLTPELAAKWIETIHPDRQRKFRKHHADRLAKEIKAGRWGRNNDMFMFDKDGSLCNGQHRASAVVMAGISVPVVVAFDCSESEVKKADQGALPRKNDDALHYAGVGNSRTLSALVTAILKDFEQGRFVPSAEECVSFVLENQHRLEESMRYGHKAKDAKSPVEPALLSALHYLAAQNNKEKADEFCGLLADGISRKRGDAAWLLLRRLKETKEKMGGMITRHTKVALMIKAYKLFLTGQESPFLRWSPGQNEEFPVVP